MQVLVVLDSFGIDVFELGLEGGVRSGGRGRGRGTRQGGGDADGGTTTGGLREGGEVVGVGAAFRVEGVDGEVCEVGDDGLAPVGFSTALLLGAGGSVVDVAGFSEVAGEVLGGGGGAVGEADVVAVGGFVGAGHVE